MSDTAALRVGEKGRVVLPAALRERHGWKVGTALIAVEQEDGGVLLLTRDELLTRVRARLAGRDAVEELLEERRGAARRDDDELG